MKALVTGAAGFIGSHLTDKLIKNGHAVLGIDNLTAGDRETLPKKSKAFSFRKLDVRNKNGIRSAMKNIDVIFHLAADPLVKESVERPVLSFDINVRGTLNVLEAARENDIERIVFTSTSAVYGDARIFPTPEVHPTVPISNYAASKIAAEAYVSSYANSYGIKSTVFRYANVYGPGSTHGVMHDFYFKLKKNPRELTILGDGKQSKSYLYVDDCVDATLLAPRKQKLVFDVFNVGSDKTISVDQIADEISGIMNLNPKYTYTGGKRGWVGDVNRMRLSVKKIKRLGWEPEVSSSEGIQKYIDWLSTL